MIAGNTEYLENENEDVDVGHIRCFVERCKDLGISFSVYFDGSIMSISIFDEIDEEAEQPSTCNFNCEGGRIMLGSWESMQWLDRCIQRQKTFPKPKPGTTRELDIDNAP